MPSSLQLLEDGERGPTSDPAIPEEGGRLLYEAKCANKRTNVVHLLPNGFQERKLRGLTSISAKPFDELYCEGRQGFFRRREVDLEGAWSAHREKYKGKLGFNARAAVQKKGEAYSSFFSLLFSS
ncbi:MAG: hypothetical protein RXR41_02315 [Candidatus Marsarchaeota archaeon]